MGREAKDSGMYTLLVGDTGAERVIGDVLGSANVTVNGGSGPQGDGGETPLAAAGPAKNPNQSREVPELGLHGEAHLRRMAGRGGSRGLPHGP